MIAAQLNSSAIGDGPFVAIGNIFDTSFGQSQGIPTAALAGAGPAVYWGNVHNATKNVSLEINGTNGLSDVRVGANYIPSGIDKKNSPSNLIVVNGLADESANQEEPTAANFTAGDVVTFQDSGDGFGNGVYLLKQDSSTWGNLV
ncbi:hypothetical protein [Halorubrum sp. BV1]|uniref:hypothetical protein n=1 Tax=Halorubrum sp. BV1 TaxID=1498500 RepID=UPI0012BAC55B|nr:hypothetical protein [Halorubrum sp. BV1]